MPTWGEYLLRLSEPANFDTNGLPPIDQYRREALAKLESITGRPVVLYATRWMQPGANPELTMVQIDDVHSFMEVLHGIRGPNLDLILHSSGGSPTAAAAVIDYIRTRFSNVRVIVPLAAMSAATMMACSANRIVMGKHSYLGPIDPQLILETPLGVRAIPAQAIRAQFAQAQAESSDPSKFTAWIPMLQQYGPSLLKECEHVSQLSQELVVEWLKRWMFDGAADGEAKAQVAAGHLNSHDVHHVHGKFLSRESVRAIGLSVDDLEMINPEDPAFSQEFQDAVLSVFHMVVHTFEWATLVNKIVENHLGKAKLRILTPPSPPPHPHTNPATSTGHTMAGE